MRVVQTRVDGGTLHVLCAGSLAAGSLGVSDCRLLHISIEKALRESLAPWEEVVVDFTSVDYEWGDGPAWAVFPAARRHLKVRYLARDRCCAALMSLFRETGLHRVFSVSVEEIQ
jgi:hypothetical protein